MDLIVHIFVHRVFNEYFYNCLKIKNTLKQIKNTQMHNLASIINNMALKKHKICNKFKDKNIKMCLSAWKG